MGVNYIDHIPTVQHSARNLAIIKPSDQTPLKIKHLWTSGSSDEIFVALCIIKVAHRLFKNNVWNFRGSNIVPMSTWKGVVPLELSTVDQCYSLHLPLVLM